MKVVDEDILDISFGQKIRYCFIK